MLWSMTAKPSCGYAQRSFYTVPSEILGTFATPLVPEARPATACPPGFICSAIHTWAWVPVGMRFRAMSMGRDYLQIFDAIVGTVLINVVDFFLPCQLSTKML